MGIDTKGITNKNVKAIDVLNVIKQVFDMDAKMFGLETRKNECYEEETYSASINFNYKEEKRQLFICQTMDEAEDTEFDRVLHTSFILGKWGSSVEIMQKIISQFGGYVDDNDCDDIGYYQLGESPENIKPVLQVTMKDIYEKFGCLVQIVSKK